MLQKFSLSALALLVGTALPATPAQTTPPTQVQVARQFLQAVLRADYPAAYGLLDASVKQRVTAAQFAEVVRPVHAQAQHFGPGFDLYKLGLRLGEGGSMRYFCAFTFKKDTLAGAPHLQLDVSFRDSVATQVLYFTPVPAQPGQPGLPLP
ncbi:hypothetical protein [Hymenobacter guriensis]|uniref:DUF3887 domain-containing protein n=1 Tax=Hymenobacter guriensis TaxID=2793065 RepID=A0ABS0L0K0_9BACT|nr:hypothetical protein [Hymenobacter guriensis]MBG8552917.1 hypothetical protein [Hymenobacter guriensis]